MQSDSLAYVSFDSHAEHVWLWEDIGRNYYANDASCSDLYVFEVPQNEKEK